MNESAIVLIWELLLSLGCTFQVQQKVKHQKIKLEGRKNDFRA